MKLFKIYFSVFILLFPSLTKSQNEFNTILQKESICLDSVEISHKKLENIIHQFYFKNKNNIDSNNYIFIESLPFSKKDTNSFIIMISLRNNLENDLMGMNENNSYYLRINNLLVFVRFLNSRYSINLLFNQTSKKKEFYYTRSEYEAIGVGLKNTIAGYKIKRIEKSESKIRKLYYFNYPPSKLQHLYYKTIYCNYY